MEVTHVRNMLRINKHRLDDELEIQADIMDRISVQLVICNSRMLEAKDTLAKVEGRITEDLRDDDPKITVAILEAKVRRHSDRSKAWRDYQAARAEHETWTGLLEAWRQRGYSIKTLADLYSAQYFTLSSTTMTQSRRDREDSTDESRAALRRAGHVASRIDTKEETEGKNTRTQSRRSLLE